MMKNKLYFYAFICLMILSLLPLSAGCITVYDDSKPSDSKPAAPKTTPAPQAAAGAPVVKSFSVNPKTITAGQQAQLQWEVTGATSVDISPVVGKVNQSDTVLVSPTATTTYILTAANAAGNKTATVVVTVSSAAAKRPDIIVTDIYLVVREVYYTAKNIGNAPAPGSRAYLYLNDIKEADDYLEALEPGQERTGPFKNYAWVYDRGTAYDPLRPNQWPLKVCLDIENTVVESDEGNNCKTVIMGEKFVYNFTEFYHQAQWTTGYGPLTVPMPEDNANGAVLRNAAALEEGAGAGGIMTVPQQVPSGYIQGVFGEYYTEFRQTRVREIAIPPMARFSATVGFANTSPPNSKAKFTFGVMDQSGRVTFFPSINASYDGKLDKYEVDLSSLAGQKSTFVLRVEAVDATLKMRPVWADPKVYQP